eukprot:CAMPEP_0174308758 /NCGR_PEP_ID=MMETSP0810-20121108/1957_1 /TAXON_ID=73025 ORGANISM="Eutreptiella gymnastica-like, Strain CCMP1594" /NCGR_SAMPLE_ID=MMETSP0810 /ASSEMBLY_ACC=CAM_ASM_000659 /LENGTH=110 /DNA_ID=CAMNT_0015416165 /DNA_START=507 /DNA_END=836 /DNA_ORIENTATION=+
MALGHFFRLSCMSLALRSTVACRGGARRSPDTVCVAVKQPVSLLGSILQGLPALHVLQPNEAAALAALQIITISPHPLIGHRIRFTYLYLDSGAPQPGRGHAALSVNGLD